MKLSHLFLGTLAALVVAAAPTPATASPSFPQDIVKALGLKYSLGTSACQETTTSDCHCTICHQTPMGGPNSATMPFAVAMKAAGLVEASDQTVPGALTKLEMQKTDSDCDGVPDVEQLHDGRDPNTGAIIDGSQRTAPATHTCGEPTESFGCATRIAGTPLPGPAEGGSPLGAAATIVTALGIAAALGRRRGSLRSRP